jgi:hypothetical protein
MWMTIIAVGRKTSCMYSLLSRVFPYLFFGKTSFFAFLDAGEPTEIDVFFQARSAAERGRSR